MEKPVNFAKIFTIVLYVYLSCMILTATTYCIIYGFHALTEKRFTVIQSSNSSAEEKAMRDLIEQQATAYPNINAINKR